MQKREKASNYLLWYTIFMTKQLNTYYQRFLLKTNKKALLKSQFEQFLPEVVFRTTKIENPQVTRSQVQSHL